MSELSLAGGPDRWVGSFFLCSKNDGEIKERERAQKRWMGKYIYTGAPVEVRQVAGRGEENRVNWNYKQKERHQKEIETEVKKEQEIEKRKKKRENDAKKE